MSSKRCLLILLLSGSLVFLLAQPRFSLATGLYLDDEQELGGRNKISAHGAFGQGFDWELSSDLHRAKGQSAPQRQELIHDGLLRLGFRSPGLELKAQYSNTIFGHSELLGLYPSWMPLNVYKRLMAHQSSVSGSWQQGRIGLEASAVHRLLNVEPYSFDFNDFAFHPQAKTSYTDLYGSIELGVRAASLISVFTVLDLKNGYYADTDPFDLSSVKLGCETSFKPLPGGRLDGRVSISHRNSDAIDAPRANLVQTRLRYQHNFAPGLSGFITWENNTCFDDSLSALYLISNYLRPQMVYTLNYDDTGMSYLRLGGKYSPENNANAVFGDAEARIWKGIYASLGAGLIPDRLEQYSSALLYRFSYSEIGLRYQHREFIIYPGKTDFWGVETRLYW